MIEIEKQRYHPSWILFQLYSLLKSNILVILYLFVLRADSDSTFFIVIKLIYGAVMIILLVNVFLKWIYTNYELSNYTVTIYHGVFVKKQRNISIKRIQNIHQTTNFLHRFLKLTSLTLETGTSGEEASLEFPVLSHEKADHIKRLVEESKPAAPALQKVFSEDVSAVEEPESTETAKRVYFSATRKDLIKASFTSLSILAVFPILFSLYFQVDEFFSLDRTAETAFSYFKSHLWLVVPIFLAALLISTVIGFIITYLKYGKFEISADDDRIFIRKGIFTETVFSIQKNRVQAIKIEQSFLKRLLGMAEVKLLSAGNVGDENAETNSLFPFLPIAEAHSLIEQLLPSYTISDKLVPLPRNVLWLRLLRPYYFWGILTIPLLYFKMEWAWISAVLLILIIVARILDFHHTRYLLNERFVQIKKGGFTTEMFITKRVKIQEAEVKHSWLQRKFKVSSLQFHNRGQPLIVSELKDVPRETSTAFYNWYKERINFLN